MTPNDMLMPAAGAPATLQVSCVQMHWARSLPFNLQRTLHYIGAAAEAGSRVVLFPEATLTSYYFPLRGRSRPARGGGRPRGGCGPRRARTASG